MINNRIFIFDDDPFWSATLTAQLAAQNHFRVNSFALEDMGVALKELGENAHPTVKAGTKENQVEGPLFDLAYLTEIGRGSEQFMGKMIGLFCEQAPQTIAEMKTAYASEDFGQLGGLAHKMKPSIDTLFITRLKPVIRAIEKAGKEQCKSPELVNQIELLETTLTEVVAQLQRY